MGSRAMTVLGAVAGAALGVVQIHEHVIATFDRSWRGLVHVLDDVDQQSEEVAWFRRAGGGTLVDVTLPGIGRDPVALARIAEATGVHIIAATGFYREPYYPPAVAAETAPALAAHFIRELRDGIAGTGIRAGVIGELGTFRNGITPLEERVLRAAAIAQAETGAPITTHTWFGELALEQVRLLRGQGADPARVAIGHFGDRRDLEAQLRVLETGVSIQYDHIGLVDVQRDEVRAAMVADLVRRGHERQLLLSCDLSFKSRLHAFGGTGYDVLLRAFVPLLRREGVPQPAIDTILIDNPRRLLAYLD